MRRRVLLAGLPFLTRSARAQSNMPAVRIGVLWDRSATSTSGLDQVVAARLAIDDFGNLSRGYPVELLDAEFERRPDRAVAIARRWFERDRIAALVDVPGMAAAAQVQAAARAADRTVLNTGSFNSALAGTDCSPTATHWLEDTRGLTRAMTAGMAAEGIKSWFLVAPDDPLGAAFQAGAAAAIETGGGRVVGVAQHPPDETGLARAITRAAESGAAAIGLCATGTLLAAQVRAARKQGLFERPRAVCAYAAGIRDIQTLGAREAEGLRVVTSFYWNRDERTRSFALRFNELTGRMPDKPHAATYAAVKHFLRAVETTDTIDGAALNAAMRLDPVYFFGDTVRLRNDGQLPLDIGVYTVRPPDRVADTWDYYDVARIVAAKDIYPVRPSPGCTVAA